MGNVTDIFLFVVAVYNMYTEWSAFNYSYNIRCDAVGSSATILYYKSLWLKFERFKIVTFSIAEKNIYCRPFVKDDNI